MFEQSIYEYDYPMVRWLRKAFHGGATNVLDIGGSSGSNYYAYAKHLQMPVNLTWRVVEVPEIASVGRAAAEKRGTTALHFSSDFVESASSMHSDLWIVAGATRYSGNLHPASLLQRTHARPQHILVNNLQLYWEEDLVTVQNLGQGSFSPLYVYNKASFIRSVEKLGYILGDAWESRGRSTQPLCYPECPVKSFSGLYFLRHHWARHE